LIGLLFSILLLQGCGGGGGSDDDGSNSSGGITYTGSTAQATIDASNAKELATGAASGSQQAATSDALTGAAMRPQATPGSMLAELAPRIAQWIGQLSSSNAARTADISDEICDAGGQAVTQSNDADTGGIVFFTNCAISYVDDYTLVINGTLTVSTNTSTDTMSMVFNVSVAHFDVTQAVSMTLACYNISSDSVSCFLTADFEGIDGKVYRIQDLMASGDLFFGFYVSMTLYHPDHGWIDMNTTQALTSDCDEAVPGSGMLTLSGASDTSATVSFDSCSSYTVTVDGVGTTYDW
jgi:hypothetical protein